MRRSERPAVGWECPGTTAVASQTHGTVADPSTLTGGFRSALIVSAGIAAAAIVTTMAALPRTARATTGGVAVAQRTSESQRVLPLRGEEPVDELRELAGILEEEAVRGSGKIRSRASGRWSARIWELIAGIIRSLSPLATSTGCRMAASRLSWAASGMRHSTMASY